MPLTISAKGQVTIQKRIREALKVHRRDAVDFIFDKGEVKLKVMKKGQAKEDTSNLHKCYT